MIATGTDIKAVEVVLFMRAVKSRAFFEQMKGRGVRVIAPDDLQSVTPDAKAKDHFVIVDAVGVCEEEKTDSRPMEQPKPDFENDHLYQLYSLFATDAQRDEMAALYRRGNFGYGQVKTALADAAEVYFTPAHAKREEYAANPKRVEEILADGASRARKKAGDVLKRAKKASGL